MKPGETTETRERAPGLDGIRALAVLIVIGFHEGASGLRGGFLGVDIFFVLSGFLITDLLIARYDRAGRLNLADFWTRRARRLLPVKGRSDGGARSRRPVRAARGLRRRRLADRPRRYP